MIPIPQSIIDEMKYRGFEMTNSKGVYSFLHKGASEGITVEDDVDNDRISVSSFAFINGDRVFGEAAAEDTHKAVNYLEGALGLILVEYPAEDVNTSVPAKPENKQVSSIGNIEQNAIDNHPGTIAALLILQNTPAELVKSRKGQGGKVLSYVEGAKMRQMANFAFLYNWSTKNVSIREDEFEFSAIVECEFTFTEGHTVTKTQVGSANKKYSKTLKNADETPRCIMIGDTIKSAITDGEKKCMSELGICQDVYSGEHKAKGVK